MGGCLSLPRLRGHTPRQRIFESRTSEEASEVLEGLCAERTIRSADSLLNFLTAEFGESPPTPVEVARWTRWHETDAAGTARDYATTSLLCASVVIDAQRRPV